MMSAELVRALRERHNLSQAELAYRAGTTQQAVSRIERGVVSPTVEMLVRLAAACGEELRLDAIPRPLPFEEAQLDARLGKSPAERAELSFSWNKLAGQLALAGAKARGALRE
jgi:transcriptional regulator with XRE-family HTH domain